MGIIVSMVNQGSCERRLGVLMDTWTLYSPSLDYLTFKEEVDYGLPVSRAMEEQWK